MYLNHGTFRISAVQIAVPQCFLCLSFLAVGRDKEHLLNTECSGWGRLITRTLQQLFRTNSSVLCYRMGVIKSWETRAQTDWGS